MSKIVGQEIACTEAFITCKDVRSLFILKKNKKACLPREDVVDFFTSSQGRHEKCPILLNDF